MHKFFWSLNSKAIKNLTKNTDGTYGEISTVKDYLGRDTTLPGDVEELIKVFIGNCIHIGLPRSRGKCAEDILK